MDDLHFTEKQSIIVYTKTKSDVLLGGQQFLSFKFIPSISCYTRSASQLSDISRLTVYQVRDVGCKTVLLKILEKVETQWLHDSEIQH